MTGDNAARRAEDIGGQELSYAEVKAIASGNPAVLTLAEADAELQRLSILRKNHADEQFLARRALRDLPDTIARLVRRLSHLSADLATLAGHERDPVTIGLPSPERSSGFAQAGGRDCNRSDVLDILGHLLDALPEKVRETKRFEVGRYRGLAFGLELHAGGAALVFLEGATSRDAMLSRDHHGPRAVMNAVERLAGTYQGERDATEQDLAIAQGQLRDHQARLGRPFAHEAYLTELTGLRDQLKAGLSQATPEPGALPVSELAERIKSLKAAHTIEAAPERTAPRRIAAEEPVTARIRRRSESMPAIDASVDPAPVATPVEMPKPVAATPATHEEPAPVAVIHPFPEPIADAPARPQPAYRQRVAGSRRQNDRQLSLF
jgi:hypothetical protein